MSWIVQYWTTDTKRWLLGGVKESESSRWERREDAEHYLEAVKDIHRTLDVPLVVEGRVLESAKTAQIKRVRDEHNGVKFCTCASCVRPEL